MHPSLPSAVIESYKELQRNARSEQDINDWFLDHLDLFGELPSHVPGSLKLQVAFDASVPSFLDSENPDYSFKAGVRLTMEFMDVPASAINDLTGMPCLHNYREPNYSSQLVLAWDEWSLPTAELVFDYLANEKYKDNVTTEWADKAVKTLDRYLPVHFPGLSLAKIEGFCEMGLIPTDPHANDQFNALQYDREQFMSMLYANRDPALNVSVELPLDMEM